MKAVLALVVTAILLCCAVEPAPAQKKKVTPGFIQKGLSWFPSAALHPCITWREIDSSTAEATLRSNDTKISGLFTFTSEGDVRSFEADRYKDSDDAAKLERWHTETVPGAYGVFHGIRIPVATEVTWKLAEGDFTWARLTIEDIRYE